MSPHGRFHYHNMTIGPMIVYGNFLQILHYHEEPNWHLLFLHTFPYESIDHHTFLRFSLLHIAYYNKNLLWDEYLAYPHYIWKDHHQLICQNKLCETKFKDEVTKSRIRNRYLTIVDIFFVWNAPKTFSTNYIIS